MTTPARPDRVRELVEREFADAADDSESYSRVSLKLFAARCVRAALHEACNELGPTIFYFKSDGTPYLARHKIRAHFNLGNTDE